MAYAVHVSARQLARKIHKTPFADRGDLIGHGFAGIPFEPDERLARKNALHARSERYDLYTVEVTIRGVIADDHGRSGFLDLSSNGRIKTDPPHLTSFHLQCPR